MGSEQGRDEREEMSFHHHKHEFNPEQLTKNANQTQTRFPHNSELEKNV